MLQQHVVADAHHSDVGHRDADAEADLAAHAHRHVQRVVDDHIVAVAQIEHIDIVLAAALQGVVALAAFQDHGAAAAADQHVVAGAALQGVVAAAADQRVVAVAAVQQIAALAAGQHILAAGAARGHHHGQQFGRAPFGTVGEHHHAGPAGLVDQAVLDADAVLAVDVLQQQVIAGAQHADVLGADAGLEANFVVGAQGGDLAYLGAVVDQVAAVAHAEDEGFAALVADQHVVAGAAFHRGVAADAALQLVVAGAAAQGVLAAVAYQGVVAGATVQQVGLAGAQQQIVIIAAGLHFQQFLRQFRAQPDAAVGEHDLAMPAMLKAEARLNGDGVSAVSVNQHDVVVLAHHPDVVYRNADAEHDAVLQGHADVHAVRGDHVRAVTQAKLINLRAGAAHQGVVARAADQHANARAAADQHIVAQAAD